MDLAAIPREFPQLERPPAGVGVPALASSSWFAQGGASWSLGGDVAGNCDCRPEQQGCECGGVAAWPEGGSVGVAEAMWIGSGGGDWGALQRLALSLQAFGQTGEAAEPMRLRQPDFHRVAELMEPLVPREHLEYARQLLRCVWSQVRFSGVGNLLWLSTTGAYLSSLLDGTVSGADAALAQASRLLSGRANSVNWTLALARALGLDGEVLRAPGAMRSDAVRQAACAAFDIPVDIYVYPLPMANQYGVCQAERLPPSLSGVKCYEQQEWVDVGRAWGFVCVNPRCEDTGGKVRVCMPFLMPAPQGRPGMSQFEPLIGWEHLVDDYWFNEMGDLVQLVNVGVCRCLGKDDKKEEGIQMRNVVNVLLVTAIVLGACAACVGSGGAAAPLLTIARAAAMAA